MSVIYLPLHTIGIIRQSFDIITWKFAKFYYTFHSPQVKRNLISGLRNLIYELLLELPIDSRVLGNKEILEQSQNYIGTQSSVQFPLRK